MRILAFIVSFLLSRAVIAAAPATLPATRPAKVDLSSPDATIRSLADAMDQDDTDAYRKIVAPQSDDQRKQVDGDIRMMLLGQRLVSAVRQHLGEPAAAEFVQGGSLGMFGMPVTGHDGDEIRNLLDDASIKWKYINDQAVLGEVSPEIRVQRIGGQWRLLPPEEAATDAADHAKMREQIATGVEGVINRIKSGELKTMQQIGQQFFASPVVPSTKPTSQPTLGR